MPKRKNTSAMDHIVDSLKRNRAATYADIKAAADKKRLEIYPIMFGRAQALLGIVKSAKRGEGRFARATAARAGNAGPLSGAPRRGPGRPRKNFPAGRDHPLDSIPCAV